MGNESDSSEIMAAGGKTTDISYNKEKDFYRGMSGELRMKAEGLFKKAKEKGISIEDISINKIKGSSAEFPGIGELELPAYIIKVVGRDIGTGQTIVDGKQIDYFNMYQNYIVEKIEKKNLLRDEKGRVIRENSKPRLRQDMEFLLTDSEMFDIGRSLIDDKEFGLEKTMTGACDRVIRKLMGENDWLYPEEAKMLEDEFNKVQNKIMGNDQEKNKQAAPQLSRKATERQMNYLKARIRNAGMDPESELVMSEVLRQSGFKEGDINNISTGDMSKIIDSLNSIVPIVRETLSRQNITGSAKDMVYGSTETDNTVS